MNRGSMISLLLLGFCLHLAMGSECRHPPPSANYTNERYAGIWYEIGKIQTLGGSLFQLGSVCTIANYEPFDPSTGGGDIGYSSRLFETTGNFVNASGTLEELDSPGHFQQKLVFFGADGVPVDYNVIWLDEDSAIEYDCNKDSTLGIVDYCLHFMSRTPTMSQEKLEELLAFGASLDLNPNEIVYKPGSQEGCWD